MKRKAIVRHPESTRCFLELMTWEIVANFYTDIDIFQHYAKEYNGLVECDEY